MLFNLTPITDYNPYKPNPLADFTTDCAWKWYNDDPESGIIEIYGSGSITFDNSFNAELFLIGGGGNGGKGWSYTGSSSSNYAAGGGGAGAFVNQQ